MSSNPIILPTAITQSPEWKQSGINADYRRALRGSASAFDTRSCVTEFKLRDGRRYGSPRNRASLVSTSPAPLCESPNDNDRSKGKFGGVTYTEGLRKRVWRCQDHDTTNISPVYDQRSSRIHLPVGDVEVCKYPPRASERQGTPQGRFGGTVIREG